MLVMSDEKPIKFVCLKYCLQILHYANEIESNSKHVDVLVLVSINEHSQSACFSWSTVIQPLSCCESSRRVLNHV